MKAILNTTLTFLLIGTYACDTDNGNISTNAPEKWDNTIYYHYTNNMMKYPLIILNVETIFGEIEDKVNLTFIQTDSSGIKIDYVKGRNEATVGKCMDARMILSSTYKDFAYHEIWHLFVGHHEHQRPDRDDYIDVHSDDIPYQVLNEDQFLYDIWDYPFDTKSILCYTEFNCGSKITTIEGKKIKRNLVPSPIDWQKLIDIYGGK